MISMMSQQLLELFPQKHSTADFNFSGVVIDSRQPCDGALFVAIKGEHFDAHDFVGVALEKGAAAVMVEHEVDVAIPQLIVDDCRKAMADLASYWRRKLGTKLVAITGSNGKTTVKEMLGKILSSFRPTLITKGNLNNDIGVPLTLFRLSTEHDYAVIEMGANHRDEIKHLVTLAEPDVVYVNNAQSAHVAGFGSRQGVVLAKGEMYQYASRQAVAVFNEDEDAVEYWKSISPSSHQFSFSLRQQSDVTGSFSQQGNKLRIEVSFKAQSATTEIQLQGSHNAQNAIAAVSLALACGIDLKKAAAALNGFSAVAGRQHFIPGPGGSLIIDDSYNANPDSLKAAVNVLCEQPGEPWLALGDMAELGPDAQQMHDDVITLARNSGVTQFFAFGPMSCQAAEVFSDSGYCFDTHQDMAEFIHGRLKAGVTLLVKGSRSAQMDKLVAALTLMNTKSEGQYAV